MSSQWRSSRPQTRNKDGYELSTVLLACYSFIVFNTHQNPIRTLTHQNLAFEGSPCCFGRFTFNSCWVINNKLWRMTICNGAVFLYDGDTAPLYIAIILAALVILYLLVRICRLCYQAFSYSNFHIHETYKFYTLALLSLNFNFFYHKLQLDLLNDQELITPPMQEGYQIMIELIGIISIYFTRLMYVLNGILWMFITLGCDYTPEAEFRMSRVMGADFVDQKNQVRKKIQRLKIAIIYVMFPLLVGLTCVGVLEKTNGWCLVAEACLVISMLATLVAFTGGLGLFLYQRRQDGSVSKKTKITVIYLMVAIAFREIYLLVTQLAQTPIFNSEAFLITYNILSILAPIVALSILSEHQLERQKCALLKSSDILLFKTIIS